MHTHVPTCIQVHAAWAEAGLAPKLIECQPLPGGFTMVVMQQLLMQDGWSMLCSVPQLEQQDALAAAQQALSKAHDVIIPGTTAGAVHGDVRGPNIMVRKLDSNSSSSMTSSSSSSMQWQVHFIDFDWAGCEGHARYPKSVYGAQSQGFHHDALAGQLIRQEHDLYLLKAFGLRGLLSST